MAAEPLDVDLEKTPAAKGYDGVGLYAKDKRRQVSPSPSFNYAICSFDYAICKLKALVLLAYGCKRLVSALGDHAIASSVSAAGPRCITEA